MHRVRDIFLFITVFIAVAVVFFVWILPTDSNFSNEEQVINKEKESIKPSLIVASGFPFIGEILKKIGGGLLDVRIISAPTIPVSDQFSIKGKEYSALKDVDVFFVLDERIDKWAILMSQNNPNIKIINLRDGRKELSPEDPFYNKRKYSEEYYWLSVDEMSDVVHFIARELSKLDSVHSIYYMDNAYAYSYELKDESNSCVDFMGENSHTTFHSVGYGFAPLFIYCDLTFGSVIPFDGLVAKSFTKVIQDVNKKLVNNKKDYVIADITFPSSEIKDEDLRNRILLIDPYGYLSSGNSYKDLIHDMIIKLMRP